MENQAQRWAAEVYELHDRWNHGSGLPEVGGGLLAVRTRWQGPDAVMLERALALNGLLHRAVEAEKDGTTAHLEQLTLQSVIASFGDREVEADSLGMLETWPARATRIRVNCLCEQRGRQPTRWALESDLALSPATRETPAIAHPVVTTDSRIDAELLEAFLLGAYSGVGNEPDSRELDEHRDSAKAIADMVINGAEGRLSAVERLVRDRVMPCLPRLAASGDPIAVRLYDNGEQPVAAETYPRERPWRPTGQRGDAQATRERHNRLHYEGTALDRHRGVTLGCPLPPHHPLWNRLLAAVGQRLWEPGSEIEGQLIRLSPEARDEAREQTGIDATHAAAWTTGSGDGRTEAVHVLTAAEAETLETRVTGPLFKRAIERIRCGNGGEYAIGHPLRMLAEEYQARGRPISEGIG